MHTRGLTYLGTVGVGASVCHGEEEWLVVLVRELFVRKLLTVDGLATSAIAAREVTSLHATDTLVPTVKAKRMVHAEAYSVEQNNINHM